MKNSQHGRTGSSGDLHSAEDALARRRRDKERSASSGDEASGHEHPAERHTFMVRNGRVPERLKRKLVPQQDSYRFNEVKEIVDAEDELPVLCGVDCPSDVAQLAAVHTCLKRSSAKHNEFSWHILYDQSAWEITSPLQVVQIIPASDVCAERCCGMCKIKKRNSDAGQLAVRLVLLKCHRGKQNAWNGT